MHDIVAHRVSLMVVEAGALESSGAPAAAIAAAAGRIRASGRTALEEMREVLGVCAPGAGRQEGPGERAVGEILAMASAVRRAGLDVALTVSGVQRALPEATGHTAHRVVRESLTNVIKHAGGAPTRITLDFGVCDLVVEVLNEPARDLVYGAEGLPGGGFGLAGLRERVWSLGGRIDAGPRPGGGFQVRARLPLAGAVGRSASGAWRPRAF